MLSAVLILKSLKLWTWPKRSSKKQLIFKVKLWTKPERNFRIICLKQNKQAIFFLKKMLRNTIKLMVTPIKLGKPLFEMDGAFPQKKKLREWLLAEETPPRFL